MQREAKAVPAYKRRRVERERAQRTVAASAICSQRLRELFNQPGRPSAATPLVNRPPPACTGAARYFASVAAARSEAHPAVLGSCLRADRTPADAPGQGPAKRSAVSPRSAE